MASRNPKAYMVKANGVYWSASRLDRRDPDNQLCSSLSVLLNRITRAETYGRGASVELRDSAARSSDNRCVMVRDREYTVVLDPTLTPAMQEGYEFLETLEAEGRITLSSHTKPDYITEDGISLLKELQQDANRVLTARAAGMATKIHLPRHDGMMRAYIVGVENVELMLPRTHIEATPQDGHDLYFQFPSLDDGVWWWLHGKGIDISLSHKAMTELVNSLLPHTEIWDWDEPLLLPIHGGKCTLKVDRLY